jgi:diadenosine tetraphosphatase ApaH/serine/threonine PP2A family protein phosphatase
MRLALLSDIHANLRALEACLAHARAQGATRIALLGDLVGYGAEPGEVVDLAMSLAQSGATVLQGNHDVLAVTGMEGALARTNAEVGADWTHEHLTPTQREFLDGLPLTERLGSLLMVHATADTPHAWHYVTGAEQARRSLVAACDIPGVRHVVGGHVHDQKLWFEGRHGDLMPFAPTSGAPIPLAARRPWLATIGSVGQPRDGDPRAGYALWEDGEDGATPRLTFFRVPYDHVAAAEAVRRSGLPTAYADRLLGGR